MAEDRELVTQASRLSIAIGDLIQRRGRMAELGSENGTPMLDWVGAVGRLLEARSGLETVEAEARALWERGIRHVIWAGMGGSVVAVQVMLAMSCCDGSMPDMFVIHPLDSTDPAALNRIVARLARDRNLPLRPDTTVDRAYLEALLSDVLMVGVAMGMTSEEPITHLQWFVELLDRARLPAAEHTLVMALPESYLDRFARDRGIRRLPLQLDGGHGTGGRMSAPSTRVFLLPAALYLTRHSAERPTAPVGLREVLGRAWRQYDLAGAAERPLDHPSVRLALALHAAARHGVCRLLLELPASWQPLLPWIEQLMEESLGKGGKGVVVFADQVLTAVPAHRFDDLVRRVAGEPAAAEVLAAGSAERLVALCVTLLRWQLSMALYGYLNDIPFVGQPAVENYKARARLLRERDAPLESVLESAWAVRSGGLTLLLPEQPAGSSPEPADLLAGVLVHDGAGYLDLTYNGEPPASWDALVKTAGEIANRQLGVPLKARRAPAAYHSTEQSEMDGPPYLVSLRVLALRHEVPMLGRYTDRFLVAQAIATWQAMVEAGRRCYLLIVDGDGEEAVRLTEQLLQQVERRLVPDLD